MLKKENLMQAVFQKRPKKRVSEYHPQLIDILKSPTSLRPSFYKTMEKMTRSDL